MKTLGKQKKKQKNKKKTLFKTKWEVYLDIEKKKKKLYSGIRIKD